VVRGSNSPRIFNTIFFFDQQLENIEETAKQKRIGETKFVFAFPHSVFVD